MGNVQRQDRIRQEVCEALRRFAKKGKELSDDTDLIDDLGLDSLKMMDLLTEVEDHFDVLVPLNLLPEIRTVGDLVEQIGQLTEENV